MADDFEHWSGMTNSRVRRRSASLGIQYRNGIHIFIACRAVSWLTIAELTLLFCPYTYAAYSFEEYTSISLVILLSRWTSNLPMTFQIRQQMKLGLLLRSANHISVKRTTLKFLKKHHFCWIKPKISVKFLCNDVFYHITILHLLFAGCTYEMDNWANHRTDRADLHSGESSKESAVGVWVLSRFWLVAWLGFVGAALQRRNTSVHIFAERANRQRRRCSRPNQISSISPPIASHNTTYQLPGTRLFLFHRRLNLNPAFICYSTILESVFSLALQPYAKHITKSIQNWKKLHTLGKLNVMGNWPRVLKFKKKSKDWVEYRQPTSCPPSLFPSSLLHSLASLHLIRYRHSSDRSLSLLTPLLQK